MIFICYSHTDLRCPLIWAVDGVHTPSTTTMYVYGVRTPSTIRHDTVD